jgi:hypothetical protein
MRGFVGNRKTVEVKNFGGKLKVKNFGNPHYAYPNRCLQGETHPQSSTFGFLPLRLMPLQQNQKNLILG